MDAKRILEALEVLNWMGERASELPEEHKQAVLMRLSLQMAALHLTEYLTHSVTEGMEPYDALLATARGELKVPQPFSDLWRAINPNPSAPEGPRRGES